MNTSDVRRSKQYYPTYRASLNLENVLKKLVEKKYDLGKNKQPMKQLEKRFEKKIDNYKASAKL